MARATASTLLPLDRFFQIIGMHPLHANQVGVNDIAVARTCGTPIVQYSWQQADRVGREEIAQAIDEAERDIARWLGYDVAPRWIVDERLSNGPMAGPDVYGRSLAVKVGKGHIISGGIVGKTLIKAGAAVVFTDEDSDTYKETATITATTGYTNDEEIALYYPGESGADEWEIRPLKSVVISGGVVTIKCRRDQLVLPDLMENLNVREVDGLDDGVFLATVDVYRKFHDPQLQVQFIWEGGSCLCCGTSGTGCGSCSLTIQPGCLTVRDYRLGLAAAHPADWDATDEEFDATSFEVCGRWPNRLRLWYRAGYRDMSRRWPNLQMAPEWERAVSYLALSRLDRPFCGCTSLEAYSKYWQTDLTHRVGTTSSSSSFQVSKKITDNPLGTTRGAMYAWNMIKREKLGEAVFNG